MKKVKKEQVFYSVKGAITEGGAMLSRGVFDFMGDAIKEAKQFKEWEVFKHVDKNGIRSSDSLVTYFF